MTQPERVARLPTHTGSFSSFDMDDDEVEKIHENDENSTPDAAPHVTVEEENKRPRKQLYELQTQMSILQSHLKRAEKQRREDGHLQELRLSATSQSSGPTTPAKSVVLELPKAIGCLKTRRIPKDHQSFATDDDQDTIEPTRDLDVHESAGGLKHRSHHSPQVPSTQGIRILSGMGDKLDKRSINDSLSSSTSEDDILDEEEGLLAKDSEKDGLLKLEVEPLEPGTTTPTLNEAFWQSVSDRAGWLVGLLVLQSMSSFILARNEALLQEHLVIVRFLTMLVGAGGNAGNQASVRVIRGLAVGTIDDSNASFFLRREFIMGLTLSVVLGTAGCIRAAVFMTPWKETIAITASLFMIVIISIVMGAVMPLGMKRIGVDPAHSSTTIQVVMDILGVTITVWMSALILGFHEPELVESEDSLR